MWRIFVVGCPGSGMRAVQSLIASHPRLVAVPESDWHPLGTSQVYIDAPGGYMDVRIDGAALPAIERAFNAAYPLHTGRLNLPYRLLMTVSGLGLVIASTFGLLGFLRRFGSRP